ncbi:hypothetical protein D3C80_1510250 [compost metagenome]
MRSTKAARSAERAEECMTKPAPLLARRSAMHRIGVTPIPPANSTWRPAGTSGKWLRGGLMRMVCPSCRASCTAIEPPRDTGSRSTPMM